MANGNYNSSRLGRDDSLRALNVCFFIAITLAAIIMIYAYTSSGRAIPPSELQSSLSFEGLKVQGQALYEGISNKASEFVEWGMGLLTSIKL